MRRRGTRAWRRPPGGEAVCWLPPWTGSSGKVKLWKHKRSSQGSSSSVAPPPGGSICTVILTVHYDGEQAVEQRLETLVSAGDDFVEDLNMTKYLEQTQWRLKTKVKTLKLPSQSQTTKNILSYKNAKNYDVLRSLGERLIENARPECT